MSRTSRSEFRLELFAPAPKQAMMAASGVLSPQAALIAAKIPRIEPLLRMFEANGFTVTGFEPAPPASKPVRRLHHSPGAQAFYSLLEKRGYQIRHDDSPDSGKAVS